MYIYCKFGLFFIIILLIWNILLYKFHKFSEYSIYLYTLLYYYIYFIFIILRHRRRHRHHRRRRRRRRRHHRRRRHRLCHLHFLRNIPHCFYYLY